MAKESKVVVTKNDLTTLGIRSVLLQAGFNYERMQNIGYVVAQKPILEKIYKDDKKELEGVMMDDLEFINTHGLGAPYIMGLSASLRERGVDRATVKNIKIALFGPLAGVGDAIFWFTLLPIMIGICSSLAEQGMILGPILFFLVYVAVFLLRIPLAHIGYNTGVSAISKIKENTARLNRAASILGVTVLGGLIASYVSLNVLTEIKIGETGEVVSLQTDFFDMIFPNLLPFAFTFLMLWLLKKKVNPVMLIAITMAAAIILSFFKVL